MDAKYDKCLNNNAYGCEHGRPRGKPTRLRGTLRLSKHGKFLVDRSIETTLTGSRRRRFSLQRVDAKTP